MPSCTPRLLVGLCFITLCAGPTWSQDQVRPDHPPSTENPQTEHPRQVTERRQMTVAGCLEKGDQASAYSITGQDGKEYALKSTTVNLSEHASHTVTVTGTMAKEAEKEKKKEGEPEAVVLNVSKLKMVSASCK